MVPLLMFERVVRLRWVVMKVGSVMWEFHDLQTQAHRARDLRGSLRSITSKTPGGKKLRHL